MGVRINVQLSVKSNNLAPSILSNATSGLNLASLRLLALSLDGVPTRDAVLAGSGTTDPAATENDPADVIFDTPYAARLHEHPEYDFSKDANPNARGKWLELAASENRAELRAIWAKEALNGRGAP